MKRVKVLNKDSLLAGGSVRLRVDAVDIIESAIRSADPYQAAKDAVGLEGEILRIQSLQFDLREWEHIYVLGAGKATQAIALALEEILGERITDGVVVLKHGEPGLLSRIRTVYAGHPVPDEGSLAGGWELVRLARQAHEHDLVIAAVTGGSSALAILPPERISLEDVRRLNQILLDCGASIFEMNAVRKHVSRIKGGRLALEIFPAMLVNLTVSDVVGDALDYITDLTVPDSSTYADAWQTLDKYQLWDRLPQAVREYLLQGKNAESPKSFEGRYQTNLLVGGDAAFQGAVRRCRELGYLTRAYDRNIVGESSLEAGVFIGTADATCREAGSPSLFAVVASGETTVTLCSPHGTGGPNQEFALSAALAIAGREGILVAAVDLDGTDGPTEFAGALADGGTVSRAQSAGLDAGESLTSHSSQVLLEATHDLLYTGPTGTNVNDVMFVLMESGCGSAESFSVIQDRTEPSGLRRR